MQGIILSLQYAAPLMPLFGVFRCSAARTKTTASSTRWLARQGKDPVSKDAKANQLRARSAYKLMEINEKYKLFKKAQTVVDLGYAPGAWSQVALSHVGPRGRVLGIDILPATPPRGVAAMQANFMSKRTHLAILQYLSDTDKGRAVPLDAPEELEHLSSQVEPGIETPQKENRTTIEPIIDSESYIDLEKRVTDENAIHNEAEIINEIEKTKPKLINVVLSDMCEPFPLGGQYYKTHLTAPHFRMSNTTGLKVADHGASIVRESYSPIHHVLN